MPAPVTLTPAEIDQIDSFVDQMLDAGKSSKCNDFREAYHRGKGAEVALARFLNERFALGAEVDFDVYEGGDQSDLPPFQAEVKVMPHYGKWVAIPRQNFTRINSDEPIILVKHDEDSDEYKPAGWTMPDDLFVIEEGEKPFTQYGDNYCRRLVNCSQDWQALANKLQQQRTDTQVGSQQSDSSASSTTFTFSSVE